ncbi:UNVERIFIED_CONTAM: hypothetical protein GTU68_020111 [Idotea baltica]|nr:hypothetical protein [Idotea baltica]
MNCSSAISAETARAKVNLALHVTGKRADGYHELDSLVVFAEAGDRISATAADTLSLTIQGVGSEALPSDANNSVLAAAHALLHHATRHLALEKTLPVSAGIGGGSADAAATLRALNRLWGLHLPQKQLEAIGIGLGADVAVCIAQHSSRMSGIGETLVPLKERHLPSFDLVLVNPRLPVSTPKCFKLFSSGNRIKRRLFCPLSRINNDHDVLLTWLAGNTAMICLSQPASVCPDIRNCVSQLLHEGAQNGAHCWFGAQHVWIFDIRKTVAANVRTGSCRNRIQTGGCLDNTHCLIRQRDLNSYEFAC